MAFQLKTWRLHLLIYYLHPPEVWVEPISQAQSQAALVKDEAFPAPNAQAGRREHSVLHGIRLDCKQTLIKFHFLGSETMKAFTASPF